MPNLHPLEIRGPGWPERLLIARHLLELHLPLDGGTRSCVVGGIDVSWETRLEPAGG